MTIDEQIRTAKRAGDVKALRKIREGINQAIDEASAETPDHPETLEDLGEPVAPTEEPTA